MYTVYDIYIYLYCVYFGLVVAEHDFNKALKVKPTDLVGLIEAPNLDG
jgi:ABC-type polysaccharide transport system permease subunit